MTTSDPDKYLSQCAGKDAYKSFVQAQEGISRRLVGKVAPYHCEACGRWHLGSMQVGRKKRMARKQIRERAIEHAQ